MTTATYAALYYGFGLLWLCSGLALGWLRWEGHPLTIALWIVAGAAVWPWLLGKIIWNTLVKGEKYTDL